MIYRSYSSEETKKFAEEFAKKSLKRKAVQRRTKGAFVIGLVGELGSGKTAFVQGFLKGLGIRRRTTSPTFILFRRFSVPHAKYQMSKFKYFYHIDAYRIKKLRELVSLGIKEIFNNPSHIVLIEWADRIRRILPRHTVFIRIIHGSKEHERSIFVK